MLFIRIPEVGIDVIGEIRDELFAELQGQIIMLWEEYAMCDDDELTKSAQELKRQLLEHVKLDED